MRAPARACRLRSARLAAASASLAALTAGHPALATTGLESPDIGVVQVGRGSAWLARADDPLAAFFNPAGLATQATGVHAGVHLLFLDRCFTRVDANGQPVSPGNGIPGPGAEGGPPAAICADSAPFPNPQIAVNVRVSDELAIGLAVLGPHASNLDWPETLQYQAGGGTFPQPSAQRHLLVESDALLLFPTLSLSYAITDTISVGAGFTWGVANVEFVTFTEAISTSAQDEFDRNQELKVQFNARDLFIPGFVVGGMWSATKNLDVAGWYKWQDAVDASADLLIRAKYWKASGAVNDSADGPDNPANITDREKIGTLKLPIPMEAKLGVRYHQPRSGGASERPSWAGPASGPPARRVRDTLSEDLFDIELDFTWANNSAVDTIEIRFQPDVPVNGTSNGFVPVNSDIPHAWKDVLGVRLGGDFVVLPGRLALRAGGFFETKGQDDQYLNLDFHMGTKAGVSGGATVRLGPVDVSAAYQHTFYGDLDNGGRGAVPALSGDASTGYRSRQFVNGGRLESSLNEVVLGGTLRF
jgi:long-chain fatty acid transport protein